jgi:DNA polymerase-3 subunit epsilon
LGDCDLLVAARPAGRDWELHVIKHGRLAGASILSPDKDAQSQVDAAIAASAAVEPPNDTSTATIPEETSLILKWLFSDGIRLARINGTLADPVNSAARYLQMIPQPNPRDYPGVHGVRLAQTSSPAKPKSRIRVDQ